MSHADTISPRITGCALHLSHSPQPWTTELHHVVLESWTSALGVPHSRLVPLCPTGHDAIHVAIRNAIAKRVNEYRASVAMRALVDEAMAFWRAHPQLSGMALP